MGNSWRIIVNKILSINVEPIAFIVFFYLIINRIIFGGGWINLAGSTFEKVFQESVLWILVFLLFLWIANQKKYLSDLSVSFRKNWVLIVFILYATCSMFWSDNYIVSLYKILVLMICSFCAAYIGIAYPIQVVVRKLSWFVAVVVVISYLLVIYFPSVGLHTDPPHTGAWRGLFFAKNYTGTFMAIGSTIFLFGLSDGKRKFWLYINSAFFILSTGLVFLSRSATAIIIYILLNLGFILASAWVKWRHTLRKTHYIAIGILLICFIALFLSNMDLVFRILNRSPTLTGRIPFWSYLIDYGIRNYFILGSGIGTAWIDPVFRSSTQGVIGWSYAPLVSDNGFMDIFLNLGFLGELLLIAIILLSLFRIAIFAKNEKTIIGFFPVIAILFFLIVNVSLSFILELEYFGWFLLIYALFATTHLPSHINLPPDYL